MGENAIDNENKESEENETRSKAETQFQSMNEYDLLALLKETKSLHDEADILHYLQEKK